MYLLFSYGNIIFLGADVAKLGFLRQILKKDKRKEEKKLDRLS